jgi:hypothetical protein
MVAFLRIIKDFGRVAYVNYGCITDIFVSAYL